MSDDTILNTNSIRWVKKLENKIIICSTQQPCHYQEPYRNCFIINKKENESIYNKLIKYFGIN